MKKIDKNFLVERLLELKKDKDYGIRGFYVEELFNEHDDIVGFAVRIVLSPNFYYRDLFFNELKRYTYANTLDVIVDVKGTLIVILMVPHIDVV